MNNKTIVLGYVDNLMFATRVESVVENLGFEMAWGQISPEGIAGEIEHLTQINPALIIVDLEPIRKLPCHVKHGHKRTEEKQANFRVSCTTEHEYYGVC